MNSRVAIQVNIQIMRAFVQFRKLMASNKELLEKTTAMEAKYDEPFRIAFEAIRSMIEQKGTKRKIGFVIQTDEKK